MAGVGADGPVVDRLHPIADLAQIRAVPVVSERERQRTLIRFAPLMHQTSRSRAGRRTLSRPLRCGTAVAPAVATGPMGRPPFLPSSPVVGLRLLVVVPARSRSLMSFFLIDALRSNRLAVAGPPRFRDGDPRHLQRRQTRPHPRSAGGDAATIGLGRCPAGRRQTRRSPGRRGGRESYRGSAPDRPSFGNRPGRIRATTARPRERAGAVRVRLEG